MEKGFLDVCRLCKKEGIENCQRILKLRIRWLGSRFTGPVILNWKHCSILPFGQLSLNYSDVRYYFYDFDSFAKFKMYFVSVWKAEEL